MKSSLDILALPFFTSPSDFNALQRPRRPLSDTDINLIQFSNYQRLQSYLEISSNKRKVMIST